LLIVRISSGANKINLYDWIYTRICVPVAGHFNGSLLFAVLQVLIIWLVTLILYRKKIFIRL
jgi:predicted acyltransferase